MAMAMAENATALSLQGPTFNGFNPTAVKLVCAGIMLNSDKLVDTGLKVAKEAATANERILKSVEKAYHTSQMGSLKPTAPPQMISQVRAAAQADPARDSSPAPQFEDMVEAPLPTGKGKHGRKAKQPTVVKIDSVFINGLRPKEVICDTGASHTTISMNTVRQLGLQDDVQPTSITFSNADGYTAVPLGLLPDVLVRVHDTTVKQDVFVSQALQYDVLLGCDFLAMIGADISIGNLTLTYTRDDLTKGTVPIQLNPSMMHIRQLPVGPQHSPCVLT
jgi:hypothetical protein